MTVFDIETAYAQKAQKAIQSPEQAILPVKPESVTKIVRLAFPVPASQSLGPITRPIIVSPWV